MFVRILKCFVLFFDFSGAIRGIFAVLKTNLSNNSSRPWGGTKLYLFLRISSVSLKYSTRRTLRVNFRMSLFSSCVF